MTRVVGDSNRSEFILDPVEAMRRGRVLDAMLASVGVPRPCGVTRATHDAFNRVDDQRQLEIARLLNPRRGSPP